MTPTRPDPPIPVLAAVIRRDGRLLVARRPAHKRHGGLWEFPGGKVEEGESWADAAARERKEELGVDVARTGEPLFRRRARLAMPPSDRAFADSSLSAP
jgi:mutator protein MutT